MGHGKIKIGSTVFSASNTGTWFNCGYKTPLELFNRFEGHAVEEISDESRKSMEFGTFFEDAVARWYAEKNNVKLRKCGETAYWSDDMPYFICHPDRLVLGKDAYGMRTALEIKCVSPYADGWGEEGTEEIPDVYYFQVQSYYACEVPCDIVKVVCMKGNRINIYEITRDDDVVAEIRKRVRAAYESFNNGIIPSPADYEETQRFYGSRVKKELDGIGANDEVMGLYNRLIKIHYEQDNLKRQEEELKKTMMESLGESPAFLATENGKVKRIAYWGSTSRFKFDRLSFDEDHPDIDLDEYEKKVETPSFRIAYPRNKGDNNG